MTKCFVKVMVCNIIHFLVSRSSHNIQMSFCQSNNFQPSYYLNKSHLLQLLKYYFNCLLCQLNNGGQISSWVSKLHQKHLPRALLCGTTHRWASGITRNTDIRYQILDIRYQISDIRYQMESKQDNRAQQGWFIFQKCFNIL